MKSVLDVLAGARERISDPLHWAQGYFAYRADGQKTGTLDPLAVAWCARGAILAERAKLGFDPVVAMAQDILDIGGDFNDSHTHAEVLAKFDEAIASVRTRGAEIAAALLAGSLVDDKALVEAA